MKIKETKMKIASSMQIEQMQNINIFSSNIFFGLKTNAITAILFLLCKPNVQEHQAKMFGSDLEERRKAFQGQHTTYGDQEHHHVF